MALAMALGVWLGGPGAALAVECTDKLDLGWMVSNPAGDDRQAIMDLIHTYYWILDDKDTGGVDNFEDLFTADFTYEACRAGGQLQLTKTKDRAALIVRTKGIFAELTKNALRTRHMVSNTLLMDKKDGVVEGKFVLLVTLQRATSTDVPEFDYVASVKAKFKKESERWKFLSLTLITDTPDVEERAR